MWKNIIQMKSSNANVYFHLLIQGKTEGAIGGIHISILLLLLDYNNV